MMRFTPCQGKPSTSSLLMQPPVHYFAPALPAQFQPTTFSPRSNTAQELDLFRSGQDPAVTAARIQQVGHNFHCRRRRLHRTMRLAHLILALALTASPFPPTYSCSSSWDFLHPKPPHPPSPPCISLWHRHQHWQQQFRLKRLTLDLAPAPPCPSTFSPTRMAPTTTAPALWKMQMLRYITTSLLALGTNSRHKLEPLNQVVAPHWLPRSCLMR